MRRIALIIAVLAVAACASGHQPRPQSQESIDDLASAIERAPSMSDEEFEDYVKERAEERLTEVCGEHRTISSQLTCARDAVLRGFDTTGEAKRNCDFDAPLEPMLSCVIIGSLGYRLAVEAELEQALNYNWANPQATMEQVMEAFATQTMSGCVNAALSKIEGCVMQRVGEWFSLSDQQVASCTDEADSKKNLNCLLRVYVIREFESAFQRMGPGTGQQA